MVKDVYEDGELQNDINWLILVSIFCLYMPSQQLPVNMCVQMDGWTRFVIKLQ